MSSGVTYPSPRTMQTYLDTRLISGRTYVELDYADRPNCCDKIATLVLTSFSLPSVSCLYSIDVLSESNAEEEDISFLFDDY